ncbi:hypothetical protein [Phenylobacterium sp.]|uniref:hypothetical protein n=1 Tax=Phenylobacterium sp. TaxID=1871053 RepID=UPI0039197DF7
MRAIFRKTDLKPLAVGVGLAAATGLMLGAAMQPDLHGPAEAEGPQLLAGVSGPRQAAVHATGGVDAYQGQVPDYVLGTDWLKAQQAEAREVASTDEIEIIHADRDEAEPIAVVRWEEPPRQPAENADLVEMAAATPG